MNPATYSSDAIRNLQNFADDFTDDFTNCQGGLSDLIEQIWYDSFGFVRMGIAARTIKLQKLWNRKDEYKNWSDFCVRGLGKTAWAIDRTIDAALVVMKLIDFGHTILPTCEAQCRPLVGFLSDINGKISEVWDEVTAYYEPSKITAGKIENVARPDKAIKAEKIGKTTMQRLERVAKERGVSIDQLLDELLDEVEEPLEIQTPPIPTPDLPDRFEQIMEDLDLKFAASSNHPPATQPRPKPKPDPIPASRIINALDDIMNGLIGQFIPPPSRKKTAKTQQSKRGEPNYGY